MEITKTEQTIAAYQARGFQLWKRAALDQGIPWEIMTPSTFIHWLQAHLISLRSSTKRQYLASCKEFLNAWPSWINDKPDLLRSINYLSGVHASDFVSDLTPKIKERRTSSHKSKQIRIDSFVKACEAELQRKSSKWSFKALLWMTVNSMVGLRPCEWRDAQITKIDESLILKVRNAKNTNGRSHGEFRHIDISQMSPKELKLLRKQLKIVSDLEKSDSTWISYYNSIRRRIYTLARKVKLFQNRYPSLYSSRHQFASNAKLSGLDLRSIGALMGHATDRTAAESYGKRRHGANHFTVKANKGDAAKVRIKIGARRGLSI